MFNCLENVHSNEHEVSDNFLNVVCSAKTVTVFFSLAHNSRVKSGEAGSAEVKVFLGDS